VGLRRNCIEWEGGVRLSQRIRWNANTKNTHNNTGMHKIIVLMHTQPHWNAYNNGAHAHTTSQSVTWNTKNMFQYLKFRDDVSHRK